MWYFIAGNFVSSVSFIILVKSLQGTGYLSILESSVSWFLIEHVFEEYDSTFGKFFLVNEDFRTLVKNFVMILRNVIFLAQSFNPLEFFSINLLLVFIMSFYKKTYFYNIIKLCVFVSYIFLFKSFLFFNYCLIYTFCNIFFLTVLCLLTFFLYIVMLYWFLTLQKSKLKQTVLLIIIKISSYILLLFFMFILISLILILSVKIQENIVHELTLNIFFAYFYVIYNYF